MNTLPEPYANRRVEVAEVDALLIKAKHELDLREAQMRVARREVRRLRRVCRATMCRRIVRNTQVPFRVGCAVLGGLAFFASVVLFAHDHQQAADMLSAAGAFWALAVMLRPSK
ncbi:hypothetical protein [Streptomyces xantholiticus]|uniref:hypothetical protein n=1 Tax=Streptomyces xantholiticus TaxID=68285 RepID=UPI001672B097|nr:hypothetical protein [Streptomyces xantholiticus]GGW25269.1 hypothetical protein GCM10010381_06000 [Streptomyces xantholiticus]